MIEDLVRGEIYGAVTSAATMSFYILQHLDSGLKLVNAFDSGPQFNWEAAFGLRMSDHALVDDINAILETMIMDGSFADIYAKYGVAHRQP